MYSVTSVVFCGEITFINVPLFFLPLSNSLNPQESSRLGAILRFFFKSVSGDITPLMDEENPYEIYTTGINTTHPRYFLAFTDSNKVKRWMEIDKALFDAFNEFELDDLSFFNEVDRHYERSEVTEATLNRRAAKPQESVEEIVSQQMERDKLHRAIAQLPEKQRRRLVLYYFGEFTYEQIADMEGCKHPAVMKSISSALKKLKNFLSGEVTI